MHFSVLVITAERPSQAAIRQALMPFQEDPAEEFLQDIDVTESATERFLMASGTMLADPNGALHDAFDEKFYREPTEEEDRAIMTNGSMDGARNGVRYAIKGWSDGFLAARVRFIPEGWREVPNPKGHNQTFAEFASEYHGIGIVASEEEIDRGGDHRNGFVLVDDAGNVKKVASQRNPKARYDYFRQPGSFSGALSHLGGSDMCRRGDLRLEEASATFAAQRRKWADKMVALFEMAGYEELRKTVVAINKLRSEWLAIRQKKSPFPDWLKERGNDHYTAVLAASEELPSLADSQSIEEWIGAAEPLWVYAIVSEGRWHEAEKAPWWRAPVDPDVWHHEAWQMVSELPADAWLTVVDCHN